MMKAVGQRDMSVQEVMHQLLSIKLFSSSFQVITASLEGSCKVKTIRNNVIETEPSLLDQYARRCLFKSQFPFIVNCNFLQFASNYIVSNQKPKCVIVKTFPNYSSNPKGIYYGLFCKYQLLKYKPWANPVTNAWENLPDCDNTYIQCWSEFLKTPNGTSLVPNWNNEMNNISEYI